MKKIITLLLSVSLMLSVIGCKNYSSEDSKSTSVSESSDVKGENTSVEDEAKLERARIEKYNAYIAFNNFLVSRFDKELNSYYEDVNYQEEFEKIDSTLGSYDISDSYNKIIENAKKFSEEEPKMEGLDQNIKDMYPVLTELIKNMNDLSQYIDMKSYVDDDYAKAREFHSKIYPLSNQYYTLEDEFTANLQVLSNEEEKKDLEDYNSKEYYARYHALSVLIKAREMENYLSENNYVGRNILSLDINQFKESYYNELITEIDECMKYLNDVEQLKKEEFKINSAEIPYEVKQYIDAVTEMKASATEIIERVQKQKPINDFDAKSNFFLSTTDGTFEKYSDRVGKVIDQYNNINK